MPTFVLPTWGNILGNIGDQTDLANALAGLVPLTGNANVSGYLNVSPYIQIASGVQLRNSIGNLSLRNADNTDFASFIAKNGSFTGNFSTTGTGSFGGDVSVNSGGALAIYNTGFSGASVYERARIGWTGNTLQIDTASPTTCWTGAGTSPRGISLYGTTIAHNIYGAGGASIVHDNTAFTPGGTISLGTSAYKWTDIWASGNINANAATFSGNVKLATSTDTGTQQILFGPCTAPMDGVRLKRTAGQNLIVVRNGSDLQNAELGLSRITLDNNGSFPSNFTTGSSLNAINANVAGRLRVTAGNPTNLPLTYSNFGDMQLFTQQNTPACFSITQDNVATGHFGFAANSNNFVIGSDGNAIVFTQNPTASLNAGSVRMSLGLSNGALNTTGTINSTVPGTGTANIDCRVAGNASAFSVTPTYASAGFSHVTLASSGQMQINASQMVMNTGMLCLGMRPFGYPYWNGTEDGVWAGVALKGEIRNYNTNWTIGNTTDYERGEIKWVSDEFKISTTKGGAGQNRRIKFDSGLGYTFQLGGADAWYIDTNKHLLPANTVTNIGNPSLPLLGVYTATVRASNDMQFYAGSDSFKFYESGGTLRCVIGGGTLTMGVYTGAAQIGDHGQYQYTFVGANNTGMTLGNATAGQRSVRLMTDGGMAMEVGGANRDTTLAGNLNFTGANPTITFPGFASINTTDGAVIHGGVNRYFISLGTNNRFVTMQGNGVFIVDNLMTIDAYGIRSQSDSNTPRLHWDVHKLHIYANGGGDWRDLELRNLISRPQATVTPANIGQMMFEATSNTSLTIKYKGSDGVVRSTVLPLS